MRVLFLAAHLATGFTAVAQDTGQLPELPSPQIIAGIPAPSYELEWNHYDIVEKCHAAFQRALVPATLLLARYTARDTIHHDNPWTPLAPAAIAVGRQCLAHFRAADLPTLALPSALQLAVALNADTLVQTIVARQLAQATGPTAHAAVLDSAVDILMSNHWDKVPGDWHLTAAHVQLARAYITEEDALGVAAVQARVTGREALLRPAQYASDVDAEVVIRREIQQIFQQVPLETIVPADAEFTDWYTAHRGVNAIQLAGLQYLQTMSHDALAQYVTDRLAIYRFVQHTNNVESPDLLGDPAPPVTGDYWFNPPLGTPASLPVAEHISLMLFDDRGRDIEEMVKDLRRVHAAFPDIPITVITKTQGFFNQQSFVDHPEQEAVLLRHYYADSLQIPGAVCVRKSRYQTVQGGHVLPLPDTVWESYRLSSPATLVIVDQTGLVVYEDSNIRPFENDLVDFIRRLHAKRAK